MSQNVIEQIINDMYDYIEECKPTPLSQSKIIVSRERILDFLDDLKKRTPDEIRRYQKIIANRDNIIAQAEERAKEIENEAKMRAEQMINETEIMQAAYRQANELIQSATLQAEKTKNESETAAEQLRSGVLNYAGDILGEIESLLNSSFREMKENSERLVNGIESRLTTISDNRREILEQLNDDIGSQSSESEDDYDFPEDTFLKGVE